MASPSFHPTAVHSFANYVCLQDREDGGRQLADKLRQFQGKSDDAVVIALPRGGVVTGYHIAAELGLPLDVIVARKVSCPFHEELTIGALTQDGTCELNDYLMKRFAMKKSDLDNALERERRECEKRSKMYRGDKPSLNVEGKVVILVDDGIATGSSARAAIVALRKRHPGKLILATPVMPFDRVGQFHGLVDDLVLLAAPRKFYAVGQFYRRFGEIEDEEVLELLRDANERVRSVMTEKKGKQVEESPNVDDLDPLRHQRAATAATSK
jgi:putative phosphoribosyl transferase